ncbi:hypothetical protein SACS_0766 [Parasaccharibacter apium]|uniref:Uncharacterized protein n=1 Tax=Parasaccharibacter apium TaxID=1510841 RepID=A0A7U7G5F1_9PROT|nr:hypothetical protein SACS_0766 [Parasaccharibacter apium]
MPKWHTACGTEAEDSTGLGLLATGVHAFSIAPPVPCIATDVEVRALVHIGNALDDMGMTIVAVMPVQEVAASDQTA